MRVVTTGRLAEPVAALLRAHGDSLQVRALPEPSREDLLWADCLTGFSWPQRSGVRIDWIHAMGLGVDGFARAPRPRVCTRTVGTLPDQMGRFVLSSLAAFAQRHLTLQNAQVRREWAQVDARWPAEALVLGTGVAAQAVARVLRATGVSPIGVNRSGREAPSFAYTIAWAAISGRFTDGLPQAVVNLLPLTNATQNVVGAELFNRLTQALFINVGRGSTVDESALRAALGAGHIDEAWLDVHRTEPLPSHHWAWSHPKVHVTPHVAAISTAEDVAADFLATMAALQAGKAPHNAVDLDDYE